MRGSLTGTRAWRRGPATPRKRRSAAPRNRRRCGGRAMNLDCRSCGRLRRCDAPDNLRPVWFVKALAPAWAIQNRLVSSIKRPGVLAICRWWNAYRLIRSIGRKSASVSGMAASVTRQASAMSMTAESQKRTRIVYPPPAASAKVDDVLRPLAVSVKTALCRLSRSGPRRGQPLPVGPRVIDTPQRSSSSGEISGVADP